MPEWGHQLGGFHFKRQGELLDRLQGGSTLGALDEGDGRAVEPGAEPQFFLGEAPSRPELPEPPAEVLNKVVGLHLPAL